MSKTLTVAWVGEQEFLKNLQRKMALSNGLAQGTLYPDVIESGVSKGPVVVIKSHHSVGGLPDWTRLPHELLEKINNKITNEVEDVTWVTYVISSKPPARLNHSKKKKIIFTVTNSIV